MELVKVCYCSSNPVISSRKFALALSAAFLFAACGKKADQAESSTYHYETRGLIRRLPPDHKTIEVEHEDIPGFMPSMTMPFEVRNEKETANLTLGDAISFRLNVTQRDSWIDRIRKIDAGQLHLPTRAPTILSTSGTDAQPRLREGGMLPAFQLVTQDGKEITAETFRGHPLVLTFIFTRCAVPNFCPRMSKNFAELQSSIAGSAGAAAQTKLLSISFDPEFDTPQILKAYAGSENADPGVWTFATGEKKEIEMLTRSFSVLVQPESGTLSHSLATALIDRDGRIKKIWRGNGWTPNEVITELAGL